METYFGSAMDKATTDMLMNWGPVFGIICFPAAVSISSRPGGLRRALWCGIILTLLGAVVRLLPIVAREMFGNVETTQAFWAYACYHIGQISVAAAGPFNMGAVTLLSVVWFAESERTTATAIALVSNGMGATVAYLNPIWLVTSWKSIPNMFYFSLVLAIVPVVSALVFLPAQPLYFPSAAAEAAAAPHAFQEVPETGQCRRLFANGSFVVLIIAVGLYGGITIGWTSLFQSMLGPLGISESAVGWMGFANGLGSNVAGIVAGRMIDTCFHHRLKAGILVGFFGSLACVALFMFSLPCCGVTQPSSILPRNNWSLATALTIAGIFQGVLEPLCYELAAELMYPVKESTSAGFIVLTLNVVAGLMIAANTVLDATHMNYIMTIAILAMFVGILLGVREEYKRPQDNSHSFIAAIAQAKSTPEPVG